jgi:hypothetical protein
MHKKYSARSLPSVYKGDSSFGEKSSGTDSSWYNDFISNLEKSSVQSQRSIYDDIAAIMDGTKSKYSSVDEAVLDMQERTGLKAFLTTASTQEPAIFQKIPEMKVFIDNFVKDRPGTSVESVIHDLLKLDSIRDLLPDRADVENDVRVYINHQLGQSRTQNKDLNKVDLHIGKVDQSTPAVSDDPLAICEPVKQ